MLQRFADPAAVAAEIERVRSLSGDTLRRCWRVVFGRSPPQHLTADLLRRMIANRVQEGALGTLDRATLNLLDGVARRNGPSERNLKIGTVLVRDYQGRRSRGRLPAPLGGPALLRPEILRSTRRRAGPPRSPASQTISTIHGGEQVSPP